MDNNEPTLALSLTQGKIHRSPVFHLNRQTFSELNSITIITYETKRLVTFVSDALDSKYQQFDLLKALASGLMELVDLETHQVVSFFDPKYSNDLQRVTVPPRNQPRHTFPEISEGLITDSTHELWKDILRPGKDYEIRFSKDKGQVWCYYSDEHPGPIEEIPLCERRLVAREDDTIRFTVYDTPLPPKLFVSLEVSSDTCHLSGDPPFKFIVRFSTDSDKPITIDKSRSPFTNFEFYCNGLDELIHCEDVESGEEVEWPTAFVCFDSDPRPKFPDDADFVEILPGGEGFHELTVGSDGDDGLEELEAGKVYRAWICDEQYFISRWLFGRKEELLKGGHEEKMQRWKDGGAIFGGIDVIRTGDPVTFRVVD